MTHFTKSPRDAVVVSSVRTAIGKGNKGTLAQTRPDDLMGAVIKAAVDGVPGLTAQDIDDVIVGTATPEAEQGLNVARVALDIAGLPDTVPGETINRFCSSGIQAIAHGAQAILSGWSDVIVAGGVESMSLLPMGGHNPMPNPGLVDKHPEAYAPMGLTAELVADQFGVSREDQDAFALESHRKALDAQASGRFSDEIGPVTAQVWKNGARVEVEFAKDEGPRAGSDMAAMAKLRTPFKMGGTVTAGTSSQVSDGAAAAVVMSREKAEAMGLEILGVLRMYQVVGVPPEIMGIGPKYAIPKALDKAGLTMDDIDVFEINEAFASQAIYCARELGVPDEKLNPNGGAIALGHPLGATGARMTATLLHEMKRRDAKIGVVSMCIGGGMGAAAIFERETI